MNDLLEICCFMLIHWKWVSVLVLFCCSVGLASGRADQAVRLGLTCKKELLPAVVSFFEKINKPSSLEIVELAKVGLPFDRAQS